ncbi:MAG: hypothetical protein IH984_07840 [Planctomycetes bacterium]|nr:hypothetical protein [Planctomycetota bacterium]
MTENNRTSRFMGKYQVTASEIAKLKEQATSHPLGKKFLVEGSLDSVAATFGVHAFVVDAARESLNAMPQGVEPKLELVQESTISK